MEPEVSLDGASQRYALDLKRHEPNETVAGEILKLFKWSVGATVAITTLLAFVDTVETWNHVIQPSERLITEHVLMTLIGASVVQVGAASAAIVYGLFRRPAEPAEDSDL